MPAAGAFAPRGALSGPSGGSELAIGRPASGDGGGDASGDGGGVSRRSKGGRPAATVSGTAPPPGVVEPDDEPEGEAERERDARQNVEEGGADSDLKRGRVVDVAEIDDAGEGETADERGGGDGVREASQEVVDLEGSHLLELLLQLRVEHLLVGGQHGDGGVGGDGDDVVTVVELLPPARQTAAESKLRAESCAPYKWCSEDFCVGALARAPPVPLTMAPTEGAPLPQYMPTVPTLHLTLASNTSNARRTLLVSNSPTHGFSTLDPCTDMYV